jgi:lipid-A-disaccharide synthase
VTIRIGIVAGEASGDLLGSRLIRALKALNPEIEFVGIAGPKMITEGATSLFPMEKLSLHGFGLDVLKAIPGLLKIRRQLYQYFAHHTPDVFIGIDAPDFNFSLEKKLKKKGINTIHYVSPSIWAWRKGRMGKIKKAANQVLTLFPFEPEIYKAAGLKATYVGHPMADEIPLFPDTQDAREQLKIAHHSKIIAVLPGSRTGEVRQHAALFVKTAQNIAKIHPDTLFLVPLVTRETRNIFEDAIFQNFYQHPEDVQPNFNILFGHSHLAMQAADFVLVASGTATLEAALLKKPMVITYRMPRLSWQILKRMNYLPWVGLPNILAERFVVPEFLQNEATPERIASTIMDIMTDKSKLDDIRAEFTMMHETLKQDNAKKAARAILASIQ